MRCIVAILQGKKKTAAAHDKMYCSSVRDDEDMKRDGVTRKRGGNDEKTSFSRKSDPLLKIYTRLEEKRADFLFSFFHGRKE